ncbi:MAG: hypothetical protein J5767_05035 [Paludibacteraceae bacterium]|nr:hypothetical protein [Paludibacteraceae bacterium]
MAKKLLLFIGLLSLFVWNVEARKRSPFRLENDTILHICSNIQEQYYENMSLSGMEMPFYYASVVIEEGVDSAWVYIPYGYGSTPLPVRLLSIPSSLKFFIWDGPSIEKVQLNPKNPYLCWKNDALYSQDMRNLYFWHSEEKGDSIFQVPETVENIWGIPDGHFSKVIIPERCKQTSGYIDCDTLIIHSAHSPVYLNDNEMSRLSYLYCLSDSVMAHILMENLWDRIEWGKGSIDRGKFHCPNYDIRKRDTSWMRDSYRLICVMENGDTLVGVDTIPSGRSIQSVMIEGIADENVRFRKQDGRYRFYVTTYDTLYRLPLEVFEKPEERKPGPKWSDFGELRDSVFTIREGVDSLLYLRDMPSSFRKVILPKSMHYIGTDIYSIGTHITCDSVFIYSDSLDGADYIDAHYYYVENEQLYLSIRRWLMESDRSAVAYCPNADIRKRDMTLQNMNKPVWRNEKGNVIKDLTYRPKASCSYLQVELEGMNYQDFYVLDCNRNRFLGRGSIRFVFINDGKTDELEYAVWTYDTLLTLQQKDTLKLVKRDGTPWTGGYDWKECVLYYVPKGTTSRSLLDSKDSILMWRSGDTIPRRYANRLAIGLILTNGEFDYSSFTHCSVVCLDKRNYFREVWESEIRDVNNSWLWKIPRQYKEFWLIGAREFGQDHYHKEYPPMHFYVGR